MNYSIRPLMFFFTPDLLRCSASRLRRVPRRNASDPVWKINVYYNSRQLLTGKLLVYTT